MQSHKTAVHSLPSVCRETTGSGYECSCKCPHSDEARAFDGTWWSEELKVLLEQGYRVLYTFQTWDFELIHQQGHRRQNRMGRLVSTEVAENPEPPTSASTSTLRGWSWTPPVFRKAWSADLVQTHGQQDAGHHL